MIVAIVVVQAVALVLLGVLVAGLLRSHAEILRALHQLGISLDDGADGAAAGARGALGWGPPAAPVGPCPGGGEATGGPAVDVSGVTPAEAHCTWRSSAPPARPARLPHQRLRHLWELLVRAVERKADAAALRRPPRRGHPRRRP